MRRICWALVLMAGCSDPTGAFSDDPDESATETVSDKATEATADETDETDETISETAESVSETGSGAGTGSATVDTGTGQGTAGTGSATVDTDTGVPPCSQTCVDQYVDCIKGTVEAESCPNHGFCCQPRATDTGTGTGSTDTVPPCAGTCSNWSGCAGDWHEIPGSCPLGHACCEEDSDTGSATGDTDTNPQPCPQDEGVSYICEYRGYCTGRWQEDTDYYCPQPNDWACCHKIY
jgi:hypothetical protein